MTDVAPPSPLAEADPFSLDDFWDRIDRKLVAGLPQDVMDSDIDAATARLRSARDKYMMDQVAASLKPKRTRGASAPKSITDIQAEW
jgi:hypothetical protein